MSDGPRPRRESFLTPEDRVILADVEQRAKARDAQIKLDSRTAAELRKVRVTTQIRDTTRLRPWMQMYAYWRAFAPRPSLTERRIKASGLASDHVSLPQIRNLERRPDFQELVEKFAAGGVEGALAKLKADLPFYVDSHRLGLEKAIAAEDYNVIPKYTLHALEIVAPRRTDLAQQNLQVNISLSPKQLALEDAEPPEVVTEPIAPDPIQER